MIVRQLKHLLYIFLMISLCKSFFNVLLEISCNDSKNQYRGIHFLDEKFVVAYRFYDQSKIEKIEYRRYQVLTSFDLTPKIHIKFL